MKNILKCFFVLMLGVFIAGCDSGKDENTNTPSTGGSGSNPNPNPGTGGSGGDEQPPPSLVSDGGLRTNPRKIDINQTLKFGPDLRYNYYYFAARKGTTITFKAKPTFNLIPEGIVCSDNLSDNSELVTITITANSLAKGKKSCSNELSYVVEKDDKFMVYVNFNEGSQANYGEFSFERINQTPAPPLFKDKKHLSLNTSVLSDMFIIDQVTDQQVSTDKGSIVVNGNDSRQLEVTAKYADKIQIKLQSPTSLSATESAKVNYLASEHLFNIQAREFDKPDLTIFDTYTNSNSGEYYFNSENGVYFLWRPSLYDANMSIEIIDADTNESKGIHYANDFSDFGEINYPDVKSARVVLTIPPSVVATPPTPSTIYNLTIFR